MVATSFARSLKLVLKFEGGYSDNPRDPGGATNLGITQATLANFRDRSVTKADVKALQPDEVAKIYKKNYWNDVACDQLPAGIDLCMFDLAVNSGAQRAIKILQAALGIKINGILTAHTFEATLQADPHHLISAICQRRLSFLQRLSIFTTFGRGWKTRIAELEGEAKKLAGSFNTTSSANSKELPMLQVKNVLQSRTIWSNIIGLSAVALSHFDLNTAGVDQSQLTDSVLQIIAAGSFISSSIFRIFATKTLT